MGPGIWTAAEATKQINACAQRELVLSYTEHAKTQMRDRDLIAGDLLHLLRRGFVYDEPKPATRQGFYRYRIEGSTPNSDGRIVAAIVIPDGGCSVKVVTMMWKDEK